jgi:hypothetical protein
MDTATNPNDLIEQLDPDQLATRLRDLDRDRRALLILLRAARARQRDRSAAPTTPQPSREVSRAD